jgi:hypothetical protein
MFLLALPPWGVLLGVQMWSHCIPTHSWLGQKREETKATSTRNMPARGTTGQGENTDEATTETVDNGE